MPEPKNEPLRAVAVTTEGQRLAKVIARAGLCSRREAETWISAGRVAVNGKMIRTPAFNVSDDDQIEVDEQPLTGRQSTRLWLYHKPAGLVVTARDPEGRPNVFDAVAKHGLPRVVSVGRLDINTEGLLLLTNDGGLKRVLELPSTGWLRRYRVRAHGQINQAALDRLKAGIEIDGIRYGPIEAELEREQGSNVWLVVALREGKNREIKNVLAALGLMVNRLIRISFGPFQLGDIPVGSVVAVTGKVLRDQLGKRLSDEAGVFFEAREEAEKQAPASPMADPNRRVNRAPAAKGPPKRVAVPRGRTGAPRPGDQPGSSPHRFGKGASEQKSFDKRPERAAPVMGRVIFDDGREPEEFIRRAKSARADGGGYAKKDARPKDRSGPGDKKERSGKPFQGGPRKEGAAGGRPERAAGEARKPSYKSARPAGASRSASAPRPEGSAGKPRGSAAKRVGPPRGAAKKRPPRTRL